MQYPHKWTTKSGHVVTVDFEPKNKYIFNGISKHGKPIEFTFYAGDTSDKVSNNAEMATEEDEAYIEWCQLSQTT